MFLFYVGKNEHIFGTNAFSVTQQSSRIGIGKAFVGDMTKYVAFRADEIEASRLRDGYCLLVTACQHLETKCSTL